MSIFFRKKMQASFLAYYKLWTQGITHSHSRTSLKTHLKDFFSKFDEKARERAEIIRLNPKTFFAFLDEQSGFLIRQDIGTTVCCACNKKKDPEFRMIFINRATGMMSHTSLDERCIIHLFVIAAYHFLPEMFVTKLANNRNPAAYCDELLNITDSLAKVCTIADVVSLLPHFTSYIPPRENILNVITSFDNLRIKDEKGGEKNIRSARSCPIVSQRVEDVVAFITAPKQTSKRVQFDPDFRPGPIIPKRKAAPEKITIDDLDSDNELLLHSTKKSKKEQLPLQLPLPLPLPLLAAVPTAVPTVPATPTVKPIPKIIEELTQDLAQLQELSRQAKIELSDANECVHHHTMLANRNTNYFIPTEEAAKILNEMSKIYTELEI